MPLTLPSTIGPDLEDYRRLGVRPYECRLTVIRRAAARSSRALAAKQLSSPSQQVGLQLSRVVTSAYRLLDPRQRPDAAQRAHVGRILPNTLSWAGQTSFLNHSDQPPAGPAFPDVVSDLELIELLDVEKSARPRSGEDAWTETLCDEDLLESRPGGSWRAKRRLQYPLVWLAIAGLAVGTLLGSATLRNNKNSLADVPQGTPETPAAVSPAIAQAPQRSPASQSSAVPLLDSESPKATVPPLPEPRQLDSEPPTPPVAKVGLAEMSSTEVSDPVPSGVEQSDVAAVITPGLDSTSGSSTTESDTSAAAPREMSRVAGVAPRASYPNPVLGEGKREVATPGENDFAASSQGFLPDPFLPHASLEQSLPTAVLPANEDVSANDDVPPGVVDPLTMDVISDREEINRVAPRDSIPDEAQIRAARKQLLAIFPELAEPVGPADVGDRIAEIETLEVELEAGSADFFAARMLAAELAWLVENLDDVRGRLEPLVLVDDMPPLRPLAESFVAACDAASLPQMREHLLKNGYRLADQLLIHNLPQQCQRVIEALQPIKMTTVFDGRSGSQFQPQANGSERAVVADVRHYLEEFAQAASQMQRLNQSVQRLEGEDGQLDGSRGELGILGRYHCLMLRDWDVGLAWLAQVSDSRIASVARREMALGENALPDDVADLAHQWLGIAERSDGRTSDSLRLHAIDLLERVGETSSGLKKLQAQREIDEAMEFVPAFLRADQRSPGVPPSKPDKTNQTVADVLAARQGLSGRILVGGEDIGVQLNYQLGVPLTQKVLDTIAVRLDRTLTPMSVEFHGELDLQASTKIRVLLGPERELPQTILVDDEMLTFKPSSSVAELELPAGRHRIMWSIDADQIDRVGLEFRDAASGKRLSVSHPSGEDQSRRPTKLTVAMVRGEE